MTTPTYLRYDTGGIAPVDRFDYWRARVAPLRLEPLGRSRRDFQVSAEVLRAGDVGVIAMRRGAAAASWGREIGQTQDRLRVVALAPARQAVGHWHGQDVDLTGGGVALLGATEGWWRAPTGLAGIEVDLPRAGVEVTDSELARVNVRGRLAADPVYTGLVGPALTGMAGRLDALAAAGPGELAGLWMALVTMLVRSLTGRDLDSVELLPARRFQAEQYITAHLGNPDLSPDTVAAALHVSRRTLYASVFPHDHGVAAYIRRQRLRYARRLLLDPACRLSIAQIAAIVGLPDPAQFSRAFKAEHGHSPRDLRAHPDRPDR